MHGNMNVKFIVDGLFWYISVCFVLSFFKFVDSVKVPCFLHTLTRLPTRNASPFPYLVQCEKMFDQYYEVQGSLLLPPLLATCLPQNYYISPWGRPVVLATLISLNSLPARHNSVTGTEPVTVATAPPCGRDDTTFAR